MRRSLLLGAAMPVVFALGVAVGEALRDSPHAGPTQTLVRTLKPLPIAPAARETITVTVPNR